MISKKEQKIFDRFDIRKITKTKQAEAKREGNARGKNVFMFSLDGLVGVGVTLADWCDFNLFW